MLTAVLAATTKDILRVVSDESFFADSATARKSVAKVALGEDYPAALVEYVASLEPAQFRKDAAQVVRLIGAGESVFGETSDLQKNGLLLALIESLTADWFNLLDSSKQQKSKLLKLIADWRGDSMGELHHRVATRELQELLFRVQGTESPHVQVATDLSLEELAALNKKLRQEFAGQPAIEVKSELIGGSRLFYQGKVQDHSWRAQVQSLINALK